MEERELHSLLIELLRFELTEAEPSDELAKKLENADITALYNLSKSHDLAHMVSSAFNRLGLSGTDEVYGLLWRQEVLSVYRCENMRYEYGRLCQLFNEEKIDFVPLKGSVVRPYYPSESMRTSSDIDVFIKLEDLDRAAKAIEEKLEYYKGVRHFSELPFTSRTHVHVELHFYDGQYGSEEFDIPLDIWENSEKAGEHEYNTKKEWFLAYHLAHMMKHFSHGGCGVRPFMDLWIMENKMGIDRHCADAILAESGLEKFADGAYALMDAWFGGKEHSTLTLDMQDYIMGAGVYGNLGNRVAFAQVQQGGRFMHLLRKFFLTYREMAVYYPSLKKCPLLFPFYQVRRWGRLIFCGGAKRSLNHIKTNSSVTDERQEKIRSLRDRLGV